MIYIVIKNLSHLLKTNNPLKLIDEALAKVKPKLVFLSEEEAGQYIKEEYKILSQELQQTISYGLVVLDTDKDTFKLLQSQSKQLQVLNALIIKGKRIDAQSIEVEEHEKQQLLEMNYKGMKPQDTLLTEPYPCSLLKIPNELQFLCFIDYALFHHYFENWIAYNAREPLSVLDLFNTLAKICHSIFSAKNPEPLSLEHIKELQASLSSSLFSEMKSKSGDLRDGYNAFPINRDAINVKGAVELLKRIKNDSDENGFMIGEVKHFEIVHQYCMQLSNISRDFHLKTKSPLTFEEYGDAFTKLKDRALKETINKVTKLHPHLSSDALAHVIDSFLKENKIDEQFLNKNKYTSANQQLDGLFAYMQHWAMKAKFTSTKDEMAFELAVARKNAWISHATLMDKTDAELQTIAEQLVTSVKDNSVSLLTPHPVSAEEKAKIAINQYNIDVSKAKTPDEIIFCVVTLVHELEILHVFHDVNCRTNYFLLNEELIKHGLKPTVLYNPNRLDCYSVEDLVEQVKQGMHRYDYIKTNGGELIKMNDLLMSTNKSSYKIYEHMSKQLNDVLMDLTHQYQEFIDDLGKIIAKPSTGVPGIFSSNVNTGMIDEIQKSFNQFNNDQNLLQFISALNQMDKSEMHLTMGKGFMEALDRLTAFSHMNCDFYQSTLTSQPSVEHIVKQ